MPIKWSALKVNEAADDIEELIKQAAEPLKKAWALANEAKSLPNLPQYIGGDFQSIMSELERVTGGKHMWDNEPRDGSIKLAIDRLRKDIPADVLKSEQRLEQYGSTQSLV